MRGHIVNRNRDASSPPNAGQEQPESHERAVLQAELFRLREVEARLLRDNEYLRGLQQELEASRNYYVELYEFAPIPWLTLDKSGVILDVNRAAATLLGSQPKSLCGIPLEALIASEDCGKFLGYLAVDHSGQQAGRCEVHVRAQSAKLVPVHLLSHGLSGPDGVRMVAMLDLRERELAAQEQKRLADSEREALAANEAKNRFIAVLSHELRTPLTPVLAAVSALAQRENVADELRGIFSMLQRNVTAEARLIDDLLDVTRISHGKLRVEREPADLHAAVRDGLDTLQTEIEAKHLRVRCSLTAPEHWVSGDSMRLRQVFWNILRNAIKFTPEGGWIQIRSWNRKEQVLLEISDSGRGIDGDSLSRVFTAFEQAFDEELAPRGGLGLGLAICRGIVELHGGQISAHSPGVGRGARFMVELRAIAEPAPRTDPPPSTPPPPSKSRILLVEDHADTAEMLNELLSGVGYQVRTASSVQEALAIGVDAGDIVVSDLGLGDGSGLDLIRTLRKTVKVRAIALSGFGTEADKRASQEAGFAAHLTKPVKFEELLLAIGGGNPP
jgi:PAS domain S-box-containing protein